MNWISTENDYLSWRSGMDQPAPGAYLGMCQGACPWTGGLRCPRGDCPRRCVGHQSAWETYGWRHVGPTKNPHSNRWDCNRVKWGGDTYERPLPPANEPVTQVALKYYGVRTENHRTTRWVDLPRKTVDCPPWIHTQVESWNGSRPKSSGGSARA
jgi:hypothetical protein